MPIYEYQCEACHHKLEKLQKLSDDPLTICPECHEPRLNKLLSAAGFRLKGSGWYETDFKTGKKKNVSGADAGSGSGGADGGSSGASTGADSGSSGSSGGADSGSSGSSGGSSSNSTPAAAAS